MRDVPHFNTFQVFDHATGKLVPRSSLTIESMHNVYEIQIQSDGTETMFHNMRRIPANQGWPNRSPLQLPLVRAVESLKSDILAYMAEQDIAKRNILWWAIQDKLKASEHD